MATKLEAIAAFFGYQERGSVMTVTGSCRLEAISIRLAAAAGGEWTACHDGQCLCGMIGCGGMVIAQVLSDKSELGDMTGHAPLKNQAAHNARFIAAAGGDNGDIAWLIGKVRGLEDKLRLAEQSARHSADWGNAAINDMKALRRRVAALEEDLRQGKATEGREPAIESPDIDAWVEAVASDFADAEQFAEEAKRQSQPSPAALKQRLTT